MSFAGGIPHQSIHLLTANKAYDTLPGNPYSVLEQEGNNDNIEASDHGDGTLPGNPYSVLEQEGNNVNIEVNDHDEGSDDGDDGSEELNIGADEFGMFSGDHNFINR